MAKNKVFLTVLVALLAGCAVLIGCAGEGAGGVSKSVDNSMSVSDNSGGEIPGEPVAVGGTETQWEAKQYWTGTIDEDFDGYSVVLIMDKNVGGPNKVHDKSFFGGIEIESIRDLTYFTIDADEINKLGIDWDIWRQLLCLKLPGDSKENVVRAIRHLEKIEGIRYAGPNHIERPALFIEEVEE